MKKALAARSHKGGEIKQELSILARRNVARPQRVAVTQVRLHCRFRKLKRLSLVTQRDFVLARTCVHPGWNQHHRQNTNRCDQRCLDPIVFHKQYTLTTNTDLQLKLQTLNF
jgi:hypothetical protein